MKKKALILLFLPLFLQADDFLCLKINDLSFEDNRSIPRNLRPDQSSWRYSNAMRAYLPLSLPYLRTDDAEEAFVSVRKDGYFSRRRDLLASDLFLCLRNPKPRVRGRLFLLDGEKGWQSFPFSFRLKDKDTRLERQKSEREYLTHRITRYQWLRELQVPGAAWFRHQIGKDQERLDHIDEKAGRHDHTHEPRVSVLNRPSPESGLKNSMDLFSGGRAISENLQLDRELRLSGDDQNRSILISSIQGITIDEIPWKDWMQGDKPQLDPIASILPHDQHALIFPSYASMLEVLDEATSRGTPLLRLSEERAESARSKEKYARQLCLPMDRLSRILGPELISSISITGSDPFLRTGTSLTLIFQARQKEALLAALKLRRMEALRKFPEAKLVSGKIPDSEKGGYEGISSEDRAIRSLVSSFDDFVVVSNSFEQLTRISRVFDQKQRSLASLEEYHFFRQRYPIHAGGGEDAFLLITDATIRRWCGPEWRIGASRRTRAASAMAELQARHEDGMPLKAKQFPELGKVSLIKGQVQSSKFGNLSFLKSVNELNITKVTPAEKKAYEFFRDRYQSHWSKYFDPICAQLSIDEDKVRGDLSVLPLIGGTDYREMTETFGQVKLKAESGDPHPEALMHWASALDWEAPKFKKASGFASVVAPSLGAGAFGWIGQSFSFYLDESPYFDELQEIFAVEGARTSEKFVEKNLGRLPVGLNFEVRNPFQLTAFLAALRVWLEGTAPGMTHWINHSHKGQGYVEIAPSKELEQSLKIEGSAPLSLYYAPTPKLLTLSLSEEIIRRSIDRALLRRDGNHSLPSSNWEGMSSAFFATQPILTLFESSMGAQAERRLQEKSWKNLHALNEWRLALKKKDPIAYHLRVWQTELICPGGGEYLWNDDFKTYESTVFGHPGKPKQANDLSVIGNWNKADFGIDFEGDGLRIRAALER